MMSTLRLSSIHSLLTLGVFLLAALVAAPAAFADLPSAVASRVKKITTSLEAADQALEADRLQTAQRKLEEAQRPLQEIKDRYTGKFDENDAVYRAMLEHLAATTERVKAAEKKAGDADQASAEAKAAHEAMCEEWILKLGPFIDHKSEQYLRIGSELNSASPEDQARCKAAYQRAKALFDEYQKVAFALEKTQELKNVESGLVSAMKYYGNEEASAEQEAACKDWVDRLAPYVDRGMGSARQLIASATVDPEQIARQQGLYEEAKALFEAYQKAEFPLGKTFRLQTLEEDLARTLADFPKAMAESQAMMSGDVGARLDQVLRHLGEHTGWKQDPAEKPLVIMERNLQPLREAVERYAGTVQPDDPTLAELRTKLKAIEEQNAERRAICAHRTFQRADGYSGADLENLKKQAKAVAEKKYAKAEIHLVTVPSKDWAIENVVEFTDTTKTALRYRVTRSVRAQVTLKSPDGKVWLQEVYLGQDQLPEGSWSALKAHSTWADPMAAENLGKTVQPKQ